MSMTTIDQSLLQQAGQHKPLTADEQRSLAQRAQSGDQDAREQLMLCNLRLVVLNMKHFSHFMASNFDDMYQAGVIGLLKAIDHYDVSRAAKFTTCATLWIRQSIRCWIYEQNTVHVSKDVHDEAIKLRMSMLNAEKSMQELAEDTDLSLAHVQFAMSYLTTVYLSFDRTVGYDEQTWSDLIADPNDDFAAIEEQEEKAWIESEIIRLLAVLTPRERGIVELRFGLTGRDEMIHSAVGKQLGMKSRTVNHIYNSALRKLQRAAGVLTDEQEAQAS